MSSVDAFACRRGRPPVNPGTVELLVGALRRAIPLVLVLMLLGAVAVNAKRQADGPKYGATADVFLSTTDLGAVLAGVQPSYVDRNA